MREQVRFVGIDYGQKRIGIAVSDSQGRLALPVLSFVRTKDHKGDIRRLASLIKEYEPQKIIVGLPVGLSGRSGPSAETVKRFVSELSVEVGVEIVLQDERFSTAEASRRLREANMSEKAQRSVVDASAAAIILQTWLEGWPVR
ncbi:MAG: Holliday junction resolvase RuvX [Actinomycetota bacterium]|jgi:putative Holliday junction resolvase|nr:Holliday junction resolvase RuvX [Actinomycetota bacterium]